MENIIKNSKILIVDDKHSNIEILESLLEESGYEHFKSTTDSRTVLSLFDSYKPDLILLDLMMPYISGYEIMEELNKIIPIDTYLPILVLTADLNLETKIRALSYGANDFLSKPFDLHEVRLRIKNLLEARNLHILLEKQNQFLEEKVKERTQLLLNSNLELSIAKHKAEESNRLKTAFLNNISHEIRTPLNGILGFAPMVIQPDVSQSEKEVYLDILNSSSERLMETINDYMDMSLIISGNMIVKEDSIDVNSFLETLVQKNYRQCLKKNLDILTIGYESNTQPLFKTDSNLLFKALNHLVKNAIKFTQKGNIVIGSEIIKNEICFYIKDTGMGISEKFQDKIFEIFMQENISNTRTHEGSGLGLSIAAGITRLLGGKIRLESAVDSGTTVYISFPVQ